VDEGTRLRLAGEGEAGTRGGPPGDLYVVIKLRPHRIFTRRGRDLHCELEVGMAAAALGGELRVPTLDGEVTVTVPPGTQPGAVLRVRGKGMPVPGRGDRGDLHVRVKVVVPRRLTQRQRELLEEFARLTHERTGESGKGFFRRVVDAFGPDS
jgi:molecular chaperone DnaJ